MFVHPGGTSYCAVAAPYPRPISFRSLQSVALPLQRSSGTCRMLYCGQQVLKLGGKRRTAKSSSCSPAATLADVDDPGVQSASLTDVEEVCLPETPSDEWRSVGRDGGLESLSTSSRTEPEILGNGLGRMGNKTRDGKPLQDRSESLIRNVEESGVGNGHGFSQDVPEEDDENVWPADDEIPFFTEEIKALKKQRRRGSLGVRRPSQDLGDRIPSDDFDMSASFPFIKRDAPKPVELEDLEYYVPKAGDEVMGLVLSGNEYKLDVDIGSEQLGRLLTKDVYPLDSFKSDEHFWELKEDEGEKMQDPPVGQFRIVSEEEAFKITSIRGPIVEVGSVLNLEVRGMTLSGRPLLSSRKVANSIAWERVRQIQEQNEPFELHILEWNSGGLVGMIEGIRAFLPINQFLNRTNSTNSLKGMVGERIYVLITEVDEASRKLIVSEKRAWGWRNLRPGALLEGTVVKIFPFGVEISIAGTSLRGMIHISNISCTRVKDIEEVFSVGEKVKALVVKSPVPHRIALSTADLESTRGLILQDKERVFREAAEMAARYEGVVDESESWEGQDNVGASVGMKEKEIANWDWLHFGDEAEIPE